MIITWRYNVKTSLTKLSQNRCKQSEYNINNYTTFSCMFYNNYTRDIINFKGNARVKIIFPFNGLLKTDITQKDTNCFVKKKTSEKRSIFSNYFSYDRKHIIISNKLISINRGLPRSSSYSS